jgi:hypothetical protein
MLRSTLLAPTERPVQLACAGYFCFFFSLLTSSPHSRSSILRKGYSSTGNLAVYPNPLEIAVLPHEIHDFSWKSS